MPTLKEDAVLQHSVGSSLLLPFPPRLTKEAVRIATVLLLVCSRAFAAEPTIAFGTNAVTASGLEPGAKTAWYGVSNVSSGNAPTIERAAQMYTADAEGVVNVPRPNRIPTGSIWIVAELSTGDFAVSNSAGHKVRVSTLPATAIRKSAGLATRLELGDDDVDLFFVRPGVGAWLLEGHTIVLADMAPVGDSPAPPDDVRPADLLVVANPHTMRIRALRIR